MTTSTPPYCIVRSCEKSKEGHPMSLSAEAAASCVLPSTRRSLGRKVLTDA